jgi:cytochrome c biogenesis protein CcmG, thiol:disulfide interchange protein DsbE
MHRYCVLLLCVALAALGGSPPPATRSAPSQAAAVAPGEIGSPLPDFQVQDLRGRMISSAALRGKVVLIDFWATWCQPCKKEMPGYQSLLQKYQRQGFVVIGFKFDTMADTEDPISFSTRLRVRYPLAVASGDLKTKFGGIEGLPTTLIYDRKGILREKIIGFEYTRVIEAAIKALL